MDLTASEISKLVMLCYSQRYELWRQNNLAVPGRKFIGKKGAGDLTGYEIETGIRVEIEIKKVGDVLSDDQAEFLIRISEKGIAWIATQDKYKQLNMIRVSIDDTHETLNKRLKEAKK